ncbi:MAG: ABC transporter permease subunit [Phycisphaerales bacterium]|nr:MAG: ABC transporter permease subunit [Phycisphaerales bacterium]
MLGACAGEDEAETHRARAHEAGARPTVVVGSKTFTESVILAETLAQLAREGGADARHRSDLGGTRVLFEGLRRGDIDAYPEYTGTIRYELLVNLNIETDEELAPALEAMGLRMTEPLGFNNTYAIGMTEARAEELGITRISDLRDHPGLVIGFSNEFMDRADGWPALRDAYGLPHRRVSGVDHDLAYRGLVGGSIDVMDLYATDAEIAYYGLRVIEDDRSHFPRYDAVILHRADLGERAPGVVRAWSRLAGTLDEASMSALNERAKIGREAEALVAQSFIAESFGVETEVFVEGLWGGLWRTTREQLVLVGVSLGLAVVVAVPLGLFAARVPRVQQPVLGVVGVFQTIPALAMLVLLIPVFGLTPEAAIAALFLYSLLPIVRNTHAGIVGIAPDVRESARALGLRPWFVILRIELPMALPMILAGIKTAAVINIGTATLAALIGAGGYGQPILTGIRLDDFSLILRGAIPAAAMALAAQGLLDLVERAAVPRGLRA